MTSKELARALGVSTATVSLVINGKPGVSDATREKVLYGIRQLGREDMIKTSALPESYEGNDGEEKGRTGNIGFVIFQEGGQLLGMHSFFPLIMGGVENRARMHGYNLSVFNIQKEHVREQLGYLKDAGCEGYVIFATELHAESLKIFKTLGLPFVLLDNYIADSNINTVEVDNEQGTYLAAQYLYEMGHRKVGYLSSGLPINSFIDRELCAKQALRRLGMEDPEKYSFIAGYPQDLAEAAVTDMLESGKELPTAYLTDNDLVAFGAVQALKKKGIRVPEDISVIGYDDRPACELIEPSLTTIRIPRTDFGAEAVSRLLRMMDGRAQCVTRTKIQCSIVKRESVADVREAGSKRGKTKQAAIS